MDSSVDLGDQLSRMGKGLVQLNLRLTQVLEAVERPPTAPESDSRVLDALLELVDATGDALERRSEPRRNRRGFLAWLRPPTVPDESLWRGIAMARATALERLAAMGILPIAVTGAFDPELHCAVDTRPAPSPELAGTLAVTHRRGWVRSSGGRQETLRPAQVSVHEQLKQAR